MRALLVIDALIGLGLLPSAGAAAPLDGSASILCALTSVVECSRRGDCERSSAEDADVDAYSSDKVLQKQLNSVAWAATIGDWTFSAAMLPAGAGGSVVSNIRLVNSVKNALQDKRPARLRTINDEKLATMGIPETLKRDAAPGGGPASGTPPRVWPSGESTRSPPGWAEQILRLERARALLLS